MNQDTRAYVAYVAGRHISGSAKSHIFDYSRSQYVSLGGAVDGDHVNVFDYDRGIHFAGTLPNLFHYGRREHISLKIEGDHFSGFDYGTSDHFSGTVHGNAISLFDYGCSEYFSYSL